MKNLRNLFQEGESFLDDGIKNSDEALIRKSIGVFDEIIKITPNSYNGFRLRGAAKNKIEDYVGALKDFNKNLENYSEDYRSNMDVSVMELKLGMYNNALRHVNRAIEIGPDISYLYMYKGNVNLKLEKYPEALDNYFSAKEKGMKSNNIDIKIVEVGKIINKNFNSMKDILENLGINFKNFHLN